MNIHTLFVKNPTVIINGNNKFTFIAEWIRDKVSVTIKQEFNGKIDFYQSKLPKSTDPVSAMTTTLLTNSSVHSGYICKLMDHVKVGETVEFNSKMEIDHE